MDNLTMQTKMPSINKLIDACKFLKQIVTSSTYYDENYTDEQADIIKALNEIFPDKQCVSSTLTNNVDNIFFGVVVNPTITNVDLMSILIEDEPMSLDRYMVEIDSKAVQILDPDDLAVYIMHDIEAIMSETAVTKIRAYIDVMLAKTDESIDLHNSVNYSNLLIYGIKYSMRKLTNLLNYSDECIKDWPRLADVRGTITSAVPEIIHDISNPEMSILQWCFMIYRNMNTEYIDAINTLKDAKSLTGSKLEKEEIDKVIKSLGRASSEIVSESSIIEQDYLTEKGFSLFRGLKRNGLRSIEDDLYEYKMRAKNCNNQEDAVYILRCISTRLGILEDYLRTEEMPDSEREHWNDVVQQYRELRAYIGSKKFNSASKNFNNFLNIDYDSLDKLDKKDDNQDEAAEINKEK